MRTYATILFAASLLAGGSGVRGQESTSEEEAVTTVRSAEIPAIDREAPEKLQTATFATG